MELDVIRLLNQQQALLKELDSLKQINETLVGVAKWIGEYAQGNDGLISRTEAVVRQVRDTCLDAYGSRKIVS